MQIGGRFYIIIINQIAAMPFSPDIQDILFNDLDLRMAYLMNPNGQPISNNHDALFNMLDLLDMGLEDSENQKPLQKKRGIMKKKSNGGSCSICMNTIRKKTYIPRLSCKHNFHNKCLKRWLEVENSCPLCREIILKE